MKKVAMLAIRKWLYKPKKTDFHPLGRFYFADLDLVDISKELDSFDGRQDPERCTVLVNRLRTCQDRVLGIIEEILQDSLGNERASREFRAKFPDDVLQETLGGQLWFGAECLAAGSVILNREIESAALRPLARFLTRTIDSLRMILRDHCYKNTTTYSTKLRKCNGTVKSALEYDTLQDVIVMFCQTLERALTTGLLTQEEVDDYEPGLMVTIPRLAILSGLVIFPEGPLNLDTNPDNISELFKPFYQLLFKIRQLLRTLTTEEVHLLEKALCSNEHSWEDIEKQLNELQLSYEESGSYYDAQSYISPVESSVTECETACSSVPSFSMLEDRLRVEANDSCQKRRRRRSQPPVVSPESLEVDTSCRKKGTVRQTSRRKSSSDSEKRDATNCRPETDVTCNGVEAASAPCQTARTTVEREDSGLGTPSHCCSMENTSPESCQDNFAC
ncbi:putative lateral signaling target protein 2 isoform X2, partial [Apostichopus japonicus]